MENNFKNPEKDMSNLFNKSLKEIYKENPEALAKDIIKFFYADESNLDQFEKYIDSNILAAVLAADFIYCDYLATFIKYSKIRNTPIGFMVDLIENPLSSSMEEGAKAFLKIYNKINDLINKSSEDATNPIANSFLYTIEVMNRIIQNISNSTEKLKEASQPLQLLITGKEKDVKSVYNAYEKNINFISEGGKKNIYNLGKDLEQIRNELIKKYGKENYENAEKWVNKFNNVFIKEVMATDLIHLDLIKDKEEYNMIEEQLNKMIEELKKPKN
ncbi:MAG: hypothetical protein ACP5RI_03835 [Candidatus Micrarchaeia archaeon]